MGQSIEAEGTAGPSEGPIEYDSKGEHSLPPTDEPSNPAVGEADSWIVAVDMDYYPFIIYCRNHSEAIEEFNKYECYGDPVYLAKVERKW